MNAAFVFAQKLVQSLGLPLAVLAWAVVFSMVVLLAFELRRSQRSSRYWRAALGAFALALAGHGADVWMTFRISPDLAMEANPVWLSVVDAMGLDFAIAYGASGQFLACVLCGEAMAWSLMAQESYRPARATSLSDVARRFGADAPRIGGIALGPIAALGAFVYALQGPFFFYVALFNSMVNDPHAQARWPSPFTIGFLWVAAVVVAFLCWNLHASRADSPRVGAKI